VVAKVKAPVVTDALGWVHLVAAGIRRALWGNGAFSSCYNERQGDWVMRMRFWGGITRGARFWVRQGL